MPHRQLIPTCVLVLVGACTDANEVRVSLAPDVISSLNGTLGVSTLVLADRQLASGETVEITVEYTDRNGIAHDIAPVKGDTDVNGMFDATLTGFEWDGFGTVTASIGDVFGRASFAVLDRTPPKVTITPPTSARRGADIRVDVKVTDEIGISQVFFGGSNNGGQNRDRSQIVSGTGDLTIGFDYQVPDVSAGTMLTMYALAEDLSGNQGAATPVTITVTP